MCVARCVYSTSRFMCIVKSGGAHHQYHFMKIISTNFFFAPFGNFVVYGKGALQYVMYLNDE